MDDLRRRLTTALHGPDAESVFECGHCGASHDAWHADCLRCGGVVTRIVIDPRDDDSPIVG